MSKKHKNRKRWNNQAKKDWQYEYRQPSTLALSPKAYEKMYHYVSLAHSEVSGFGKVTKQIKEPAETFDYGLGQSWTRPERAVYVIEDVVLLEQTCSSGGTTIDKKMRARFIVDFIRKHKRNPTEWYLWWHSHYNFGVYWSGIDDTAIEQLVKEGDENTVIVSTCMNQQGHVIARRDTQKLRNDSMHVSIQPYTTPKKLEAYTKEVKQKVKEYKYKLGKWADLDEYTPNWYVDFIKERIAERRERQEKPLLITDQRTKPVVDTTKQDSRISMVTNVKGVPQTLYWDSSRRCFVDKNGKLVTYEEISYGRRSHQLPIGQ